MSAITGHWLAREVGWVLLHSLWQGAVVGAVFALARHGLRGRGAQAHYGAGCLALLALAAGPVATVWLWPAPAASGAGLAAGSGAPALAAVSESGGAAAFPAGATASWLFRLEAGFCWGLAPWLAAAWALGVGVCLMKLMRGCLWVRQLRRCGTEGVDPPWLRVLDDLRLRLEISRPVGLLKSALVEAPTVIGWLRPVILLPAIALTGLTPEQLEAILAHELAHIRRLDCLVNACQCALETLMFYHPAVWWISGCVREEREHCCDDLVVRVCSNRLAYARALAALAESSAALPGLALAATGGPLLTRIRRLLGVEGEPGATGARQLTGLTLLTVSLPLILVGAWLLLAPRAFEATARIKIERDPTDIQLLTSSASPMTYDPYFIQTEFEVLQSELVLGRVVDALKLRQRWRQDSANGQLGRPEAIQALKGRLSLRPVRNTMLIEIRARGRDGTEAAELANAVASAYRDYRDEGQDKLAGLDVLLKQHRELSEQIDHARTNLEQLCRSLKIPVSMAGEAAPGPIELAESIRHLNTVRLEQEAELLRTKTLYLDLSNEVVQARATTADLQNKIEKRLAGLLEAWKVKVAAMEQGLANLDQKVEEAEQQKTRLAVQTQPYRDGKRRLEEMVRFRSALENRLLGERAPPKSILVTIIDLASPPPRAGSPNRPLGGALIGCGVLLDLLGAMLMRPRRRP